LVNQKGNFASAITKGNITNITNILHNKYIFNSIAYYQYAVQPIDLFSNPRLGRCFPEEVCFATHCEIELENSRKSGIGLYEIECC